MVQDGLGWPAGTGIIPEGVPGMYGSRSRKNQKLLDSVKKAVEESQSC